MAVLTSLSVPPTNGAQTGTLMPKLQYRFRVGFTFVSDPDGTELTANVVSATRPTLTHDEMTIDTYNSRIYLAGKHSWEPVTITIRDDLNNNVIKALDAQMARQVDMATQSAARSGVDYKFTTTIETLDGSNGDFVQYVDQWVLQGCYIQNISYGESNYATSDAQLITVTLRYDNAMHNDDTATDLLEGNIGFSDSSLATTN